MRWHRNSAMDDGCTKGFLDNRIEGTVVGRIWCSRRIGPVDFYLKGNFKADIAGQVIRFRNGRFEDEDMASQVIGDMENPQIGTVNLISFDPHPEPSAASLYRMVFDAETTTIGSNLSPAMHGWCPNRSRRDIDEESRQNSSSLGRSGHDQPRPKKSPIGCRD